MKRVLKLWVCHIIYYTGLLSLFIKLISRINRQFPLVIVNYHRFVKDLDTIIETHPSVSHLIDDFKKELKFLQSHFDIISFDTAVETLERNRLFSKPTIALTIDDGYKDNFDLLFPILKENEIPAIIFLATSIIGTKQRNWYDQLGDIIHDSTRKSMCISNLFGSEVLSLEHMAAKRLTYNRIVQSLKDTEINVRNNYLRAIEEDLGAAPEKEPIMLDWDEVRAMHKSNISFGAHTHTHPILTKMPLEEARKDILNSKLKIEHELGVQVRHFAYPNGRMEDFSDDLRKYCQEIGFSSISTFHYGNNCKQSDIWGLKRIGSESPISLFAVNIVKAFCQRR